MKWEDVEKEITALSEEEIMYVKLLADIVSVRKEKGLTQRNLAELTGLEQSAIARFETPHESANIKTVLKIVNALGYEVTIKPKSN